MTAEEIQRLRDAELAALIRGIESGDLPASEADYATACSAAIDRFLQTTDIRESQMTTIRHLRD